MSYLPFCSVEIEFSNMQGLHDLINECNKDKKTLVICDSFTTDLWDITKDIEAAMKLGHMAWIDKCPGNPTQQDILNALDEPCEINELLEKLCEIYSVKPSEIKEDVEEFLADTVVKGVVEIV